MKEYKFINLKCRFFSGTYDASTLENELNSHAKKGWIVNAMNQIIHLYSEKVSVWLYYLKEKNKIKVKNLNGFSNPRIDADTPCPFFAVLN